MRKIIVAMSVWISCVPAFALEETIGKVDAKGIVFKDKISVVVFDDPTIDGVACYTTVYDRALTWENSGESSIACRQVGAIRGQLEDRSNVFSQSKNPFFKTTRVDRFYDARRKVLIYLSYTTATSGNNASHSISVVPVGN